DGTIILDGSLAGSDADGLTLDDSFFTISGLEITNFDGDGLVVLSGSGSIFYDNSIHGNNGLGIDLNNDGVTPNDYLDGDSGPNELQNAPVLQRVIISGTETIVQGFLLTKPNEDHDVTFYSNTQCDASFFGEGEQVIGSTTVSTDGSGYTTFLATLPVALPSGTGVTAVVGFDAGPLHGTSEFSRCLVAGPNNDTWPNAYEIPLTGAGDQKTGTTQQYLSRFGQSSWFRFQVAPNSTVIVDMTSLPANYDLVLFRDIGQTYESLTTPASLDDLVELNAEFAPEMFSPEMFSPEMFSPEMFSPEMFSPEMFSPEMFSPEMFSPEMFSPEMFSPEMFSPEMFSPEMFSPEMFSPEMFSPEMFSPEMFSPEMFSPDMAEPGQRYFINAQAQSAVAVSGYDGTANETVIANTWSETGFFYVRVSGRNGIFHPMAPFTLDVTLLGSECVGLTDFEFTPDTSSIVTGTVENLILVDYARMTAVTNITAMQSSLNTLAAQVNGKIVDVNLFAEINAANSQADLNPECVFGKNLVAYAIKDVVDAYRDTNPIENIVVVGNDDMIPFFRYRDGGLLANEDGFVPPVEDATASQASLRLGYVLSQDTYGASVEIDRRNSSIPIPELPVGRLVETPDEIISVIDAFLSTGGTVPTPSTALVTGYDFLDDAATAVQSEFEAGLGSSNPVDSLISAATVAPENAWNADQMRTALLENGRHDLIFLAGHFSASSALAADYNTRVLASEVAASSVDMSNAIVFSAGCHSGYNVVDEHGIPGVTDELDWAQVFAQKGAVLIAGTGYQYGDTDFVEYSERLYLEFSRALREGTGPVSVGEALVRAKQTYLADTAQMRPIHEKVLLQSTLFGLPMLSIDLPAGRGPQPTEPSIVTTITNTATAPGLTLGLVYTDVTVAPPITPTVKILENTVDETAVSTLYYVGEDGQVVNPAEPILPLDQFNVTVPGTVLRGVGFRGATYTDNVDVIPLTSAATTEIRGIHTPFIATAFYPVVPWEVNYFDALANSAASGETRLSVTPVQYLSNDV
ncbi:MAG: hypothetical protein GY942_07555, partial [Aestuariibacter sp.]|nr:hypothetical protein [Aestuariibacter sp.]